ncbi:putative peroxisomal dehydratase [Pyronema domesticum]|uniref:Similar to Probable enoyl-CoA hydratase 2 acc. no. Q54XZ0 n=1 Tax=Pyronema omphalodes (strain CBS 100304) TaxID=1076935 RepID=U4LA52_PYROM|nr:putative peroxisomal dehydratase [Pyronema domesticum]CCX16262.1 Similar to Probable enoyl-CoA hydratase 2; acc. no. Q54XZ0 [Pyronema omphalodes CBS 100304]
MAEAAGFEFPSIPVSWVKRDLLVFANSIGATKDELHFLYELHPSFTAFPTYPIILSFKHTDQEVVDFYARSSGGPSIPGVPKLDPRRIVDGQRQLTVIKPIPATSAGKTFELRGKVIGVYDKGRSGTVTEIQHELIDKSTGEVYTRILSSSFAVGQGGWGGPKGPKGVNYPPPERKPDAIFTYQTTEEQALLYRINGDYNPLHADPTIGTKMGFPGAILHGLCTWNVAARGVLRMLGNSEGERLKSFQARFAAPVMPGDKLVTEMWVTGAKEDGAEEVRFMTRVEGGKVVLSNGRALLTKVEKKAESKL